MALVAVVLTARWLRDELHRGAAANPAKRLYVAATAALFVTILVNPIAGFLGYVGAHAVEYFINEAPKELIQLERLGTVSHVTVFTNHHTHRLTETWIDEMYREPVVEAPPAAPETSMPQPRNKT
mgnify:CR=1 FL=1